MQRYKSIYKENFRVERVLSNVLLFYSHLDVYAKGLKPMAKLVNAEMDLELHAPTALLAVRVQPDKAPMPSPPTQSDIAMLQYAYALLKQCLMRISVKRTRALETFELMEFRPCFSKGFGFQSGKNKVCIDYKITCLVKIK